MLSMQMYITVIASLCVYTYAQSMVGTVQEYCTQNNFSLYNLTDRNGPHYIYFG